MLDRKIRLRSVNPYITCRLCRGYLVEATTITECLHTFCRSCIVRYLEEKNTCPTCGILIHQSYPLDYISHDRTMQDIVYRLVPNLQKNELKRQIEFYKSRGLPFPTSLFQSDDIAEPVTNSAPKSDDPDFHRHDDLLSLYLESKTNQLKNLKRRYIRISCQATITQIKKFVALKVLKNIARYTDVDILCNEELLGKDHTLKFVTITRWNRKDVPLLLHYRQKVNL